MSIYSISAERFAQKLKEKFPRYAAIPDEPLILAFVRKYPIYTAHFEGSVLTTISWETPGGNSDPKPDPAPEPAAALETPAQNGPAVEAVPEAAYTAALPIDDVPEIAPATAPGEPVESATEVERGEAPGEAAPASQRGPDASSVEEMAAMAKPAEVAAELPSEATPEAVAEDAAEADVAEVTEGEEIAASESAEPPKGEAAATHAVAPPPMPDPAPHPLPVAEERPSSESREVPLFSSYAEEPTRSNGKLWLALAVVLCLAGGCAYWAAHHLR